MAIMTMHDIALTALVIFFIASVYAVYFLYDLLKEVEGFRREYRKVHRLDSD